MPPQRKGSTAAAGHVLSLNGTRGAAMPPPPDPPLPQGILEPEMTALSTCLRNAVTKTAQVYGFYADAHKLGIDKYAPSPPRSLTASLGREIEKYDQLCDAMESQLHRAIAVLQRDLRREEQRLQAQAAAEAHPPPIDNSAQPKTPPLSPSLSAIQAGPSAETASRGQTPKPVIPTPARRQSTISLSSLQRPPFPHKLDLSSATLRMNPEDVLVSGLSSPVTLAPKSSYKIMPQDLVMGPLGDPTSRPVDIDLTVGDDIDMHQAAEVAAAAAAAAGMDPGLGSSADKPIELDLDMDMDMSMDLLGNVSASGTTMDTNAPQMGQFLQPPPDFVTTNSQTTGLSPNVRKKEEEDVFLDVLSSVDAGDTRGLFASLEQPPSSNAGDPTHLHPPPANSADGAPSPGSILAGLNPSSSHPAVSATGHEPHFDLNGMDLSTFSTFDTAFFNDHPAESGLTASEMENFLVLGNQSGEVNK
ncbi:uncharacterized protein FIBRA_03364 [Fibroporia radiculosa]|uniref:Uncharacterized protein n=1 Tax=Fibroporia radiculosa TaxID=599839 RepID=J4GNF8_9APHY|nr:uncharacterized protein FIBRA_03364 [Fibroporia radiculosa]CCM01315.1 predicted protein [Fibroporia radiculosa]